MPAKLIALQEKQPYSQPTESRMERLFRNLAISFLLSVPALSPAAPIQLPMDSAGYLDSNPDLLPAQPSLPDADLQAHMDSLQTLTNAQFTDMSDDSAAYTQLKQTVPVAFHDALSRAIHNPSGKIVFMPVDEQNPSPLASGKAAYTLLATMADLGHTDPSTLQSKLCTPLQGLLKQITDLTGISLQKAQWLMFASIWKDADLDRAVLDSLRYQVPELSESQYTQLRGLVISLKTAYVDSLMDYLKTGQTLTQIQTSLQDQNHLLLSSLVEKLHSQSGHGIHDRDIQLVLHFLSMPHNTEPQHPDLTPGPWNRFEVPVPHYSLPILPDTTPPPAYREGFPGMPDTRIFLPQRGVDEPASGLLLLIGLAALLAQNRRP